jgi:diguanylate cyclase (GGDEF)-like protein/PAS domain S-box-containing protein
VRNGKPYAVFSVYSDYADAFDEEIVQLLEEMTGNISFALDNIDRQNLRLQAETALRHSEERLKGFYNAGLLGVIYWNILGRITGANDKFLEIVGYTREDMLMERISWLDMTPPEYRAQDTQAIQELNESGLHQPFEKEYIRKDGTRIPVMVAGAMLKDSFSEGVAFVMDITERKKSEVEIKLAAMVYRDSSEAMMVTDADRNIIAVNPAFEHITGYKNDEVIGRNLRVLKSDRHDGLFYHAMWKEIYTSGRWKGELWNRKKNGELFAAQLSINTILKEDGSHHRYVGLLSDITEKKQSEDLIWTQANFDNLTGLPNRRMFRDHLQQEIRKSQRSQTPLALMFLDLDGFKYVNDTLGHDMGDILLKEAAQRLNGCMRASDSVARLGGDEFTVILSELHDPGNVDRVARHILKTLSDPFQLGEEIVHVSASIGITLYPNDSTEIEDLIKNADQAMYAAKQEGKNRFHYFTPALQELAIAKMRLVNDLRSALNENQFEIVYQPIVELVTGTIHKAEALIRWQHPTRGLINPVEFISTAEDTGMIASFGNWIFHEAASQASQWRNKYHAAFQISVNISPVQFRNEGIDSSNWLDRLQELGLPGQGVVVEITEGLLLDASTKVTDQLLMLRDAGIEVALDDFGTGYSSLSYLKKFDIDYLKIDQSFVRNLTPDSDDLALCEAIIVMAHKLGIKVIAEGIETKEQSHLLASAGCDYGQGYLFSKPVFAAEFELLFTAFPILAE